MWPTTRLKVALALLLLAGCGEPPKPAPEDAVTWGLGLDIQADLPPPGPFLEPAEELRHLFAFANESIEPMFSRCERPDRPERAVTNLASEWRMYAFIHLRDVCKEHDGETSKAAALAAIANGTEAGDFTARLEQANRTLDALVAALHAMPTPRTRTDAEFQGWLAGMAHERILYRDGAISGLADYEASRGAQYNEYNLIDSFQTFQDNERYAQAYHHFMRAYDWDWQEGACSLPSVETASAEIHASYDRAFALAQSLADPEDARYITTFYGYLVKVTKPAIEFHVREGFVPALIQMQHDLDFDVAYWENLTTTARPTLAEARWLIADHHAKGRALSMEGLWANEYAIVEQVDFWEDDPDRAVRPIALQAVHWRFADLEC